MSSQISTATRARLEIWRATALKDRGQDADVGAYVLALLESHARDKLEGVLLAELQEFTTEQTASFVADILVLALS